ncbi:hypothetical protein GN956_G17384 [Arapaima gigas]
MAAPSANSTQDLHILEKISVNDITSRANYCYAILFALGIFTAIFLYYSFMKHYKKAKDSWSWQDTVLCNYSICEFYILLFSTSSLAHRPGYMYTTNFNCAVLSFFFNLACICGEFLQVLMALVFACHKDHFSIHTCTKVQDRPTAAVGATFLLSLLLSAVLAALRAQRSLYDTDCQLDPFSAPYNYDVAKMTIGFILPVVVKLVLLLIWIWADPNFLSSLKDNPAFPTITMVTFACRLFYNIVLMKRAGLKPGEIPPWKEALMNVAEFVLFSASSICLVLILYLHEPCRKILKEATDCLRKWCGSLGRRETNGSIITTYVEVQRTLVNND